MANIVIICPVRGGTPDAIYDYVAGLEQDDHKVHFPPRDNPQDSATGYEICLTMLEAIEQADEIHVFYSAGSQGCHFDLGMAFALAKKVKIMNPEVDMTPNKSYVNVFTRQ